MQYFVIIFATFSILALVQGKRDRNDPFVTGKCQQIVTGYTFTPEKNGCSIYSAEGCRVTGNFFNTRQQCEKNDFLSLNYGDLVELQRNLLYLLAVIS
ncbi:uncharacterized protein Dere_GG26743 [Drosophila erecta]|uniref:BPTI/Kunitz inhibitor domain-containing protein n=1 Tax=Drosophila erecta TaxID=7220 RepID=A0A0Q5WM91_DROER|nr:uncharacterized protein Dere_GG26743 [Drosophila erecta]